MYSWWILQVLSTSGASAIPEDSVELKRNENHLPVHKMRGYEGSIEDEDIQLIVDFESGLENFSVFRFEMSTFNSGFSSV